MSPDITALPPHVELDFTLPASITIDDMADNFISGAALCNDPADFIGTLSQDLLPTSFVSDAESLRHDRLESEFGSNVDTSLQLNLNNGDSFAFRAGADGNATLPAFFPEFI